jgi:predicted transcriptional regulator
MSTPLITADMQITGEDALRMMVNNNVGRLLITDNEEIVGIFSTSDMTKLVP